MKLKYLKNFVSMIQYNINRKEMFFTAPEDDLVRTLYIFLYRRGVFSGKEYVEINEYSNVHLVKFQFYIKNYENVSDIIFQEHYYYLRSIKWLERRFNDYKKYEELRKILWTKTPTYKTIIVLNYKGIFLLEDALKLKVPSRLLLEIYF